MTLTIHPYNSLLEAYYAGIWSYNLLEKGFALVFYKISLLLSPTKLQAISPYGLLNNKQRKCLSYLFGFFF